MYNIVKRIFITIFVWITIKLNPKKYAMVNGVLCIRDGENRYIDTYIPLDKHMGTEHNNKEGK